MIDDAFCQSGGCEELYLMNSFLYSTCYFYFVVVLPFTSLVLNSGTKFLSSQVSLKYTIFKTIFSADLIMKH